LECGSSAGANAKVCQPSGLSGNFRFSSAREILDMAIKALRKDGFYGWINLAVMFFFNIAVMLMMKAFGQFLPFWLEEFKKIPSWNTTAIMGAQTLALMLMGLAAPIVGIYIAKWGARRAIILGNIMCVTGWALVSFQTEIWHLYGVYGVIVGTGMSLGGMLAMMTVINNWFILKRSLALAVSMSSMGLSGFVISPLLMRTILSIGWRPTCRIVAAVVFVLCVLVPGLLLKNKPGDLGQVPDGPLSLKKDEKKGGGAPRKTPYTTPVDFTAKEALKTPTLWLLVIYGTLMFFAMNGLMPNQIKFLSSHEVGITYTQASWADGILSGFMAFSSLAIGILGLRFNMHSLAISSMGLAIVGYITILFAHSMPVIIAYCIILGIGFGIQSIAMGNLFPNFFGVSEFPKIMGYTMPFNTIVSSFGATVTGFIFQKTGRYLPAFELSVVLLVIAFICIIFAKPPVHPSLKIASEKR
jgi:MFS family permease